MRIIVHAKTENKSKIELLVLSSPIFSDGSSIEFLSSSINNDTPWEYIIIDEHHIDVVNNYETDEISSKLYLLFFDSLVTASNLEHINQAQHMFYQKQDWGQVKRLNKIKIFFNRLLKREVLDTYPSRIQLESTSVCNAQCIMCRHFYAGNHGAVDMDDRLISKLKEVFPYIEVLIMHGNGEPFISRTFDACIDIYSKYNIKLTTNTNLSVLTENQIDMINQNFVSIQVSCDACTKEIYEGIRKNLSFDKFIANTARLRDMCPSVPKTLVCVVMRQNLQQIPEIVDFAVEYGFSEVVFADLGTNPLIGNELDNVQTYPFVAAKQFRKCLQNGQKYQIKVTIPSDYDLTLENEIECSRELAIVEQTPFFKTDEETDSIKAFARTIIGDDYLTDEDLADLTWDSDLYDCKGICDWCISSPYIDLRGNVYVCCINSVFRIGNVHDYESFLDLWNHDTYKKIRKLFYSGKLPAFCNNCQFIRDGSLKNLFVKNPDKNFYRRRHVSNFYRNQSGADTEK
ncbi:MAG: SPASM domain-containing protein [Erysipelothrix sp.]|nr:SPASM domain-containing protein [Erysipelothrix sp.]